MAKTSKQVKERLEILLEKLMNKRGDKCPACDDTGKWQYVGHNFHTKEQYASIYHCLGCQDSFYYIDIKTYNKKDD